MIVLRSTLVWCKVTAGVLPCCYFYYVFIWFRPCVLCGCMNLRSTLEMRATVVLLLFNTARTELPRREVVITVNRSVNRPMEAV